MWSATCTTSENICEEAVMKETRENEEERPWEQPELMTPQERRMYVLGALKAALLIGLAFIVGLGLVVLFLLQIWT